MSRLPDNQFAHRRTIHGFRVLVREQPAINGILPENFTARIKAPAGNIDVDFRCNYYWQAYNGVTEMWPSLASLIK